MVREEAREVLFTNTIFIVNPHANFHQLPFETGSVRKPLLIKHLVWKIATNDLQQRWRNGDLNVSGTRFPGLRTLKLLCSAPNWESTGIIRPRTILYKEGRQKMLSLGMSFVDGIRFHRLVEDRSCRGQIRLKLSQAIGASKDKVSSKLEQLHPLD